MRAAAEARGSSRHRQALCFCTDSVLAWCQRQLLFPCRTLRRAKWYRRAMPLVAAQHTTNKAIAYVCSQCFCYLGSVEAQVALRLLPGGDAAGDLRSCARTD